MPDTHSIFATVKDCQPLGSVDLGGATKIFRIEAEIETPRNRYLDDIYLVNILEPVGLNALLPEMGVTMEREKFSFDSTDEVREGTKLKLSVSPSHD
jgi:hypothetical protein